MSGPWEDFSPQAKAGDGPWNDFAPATKPKPAVTTSDHVNAAAAGVNRGFFTGLLGLPGDTVENVLDLGRAGVGTVATALGHPEYAPDIPDRAKVVGTSDWIARKINDVGLGATINNPHPEDKASRILHSGGQMAGMSIAPSGDLSIPAQLANMGKGAVSGIAAGVVGEDHPEWAGVAAMAPQVLGAAGPVAVRGAIRGGEAGRQAMVDRMAALKAGGIDNPSVGLATGNSFVSGLENLLSQTPGSIGLFDRARAANVAGMQAKTEGIRDAISPEYGPVVAGEAIQGDLTGSFRQRTKETAKKLADRVASLVGNDTVVPVDNSLATSQRLSSPIPGAEATSSEFINPRIAGIADNLRTDVYGALPGQSRPLAGNPTENWPVSQPEPGGSLMNPAPAGPVNNPAVWNIPVEPNTPMAQRAQSTGKQAIPNASLWNAQKEQGIPFSALKALRTSIGDETASSAIMGTPEQAQFKQLYGAMSEDMRNAAGASDRANSGVPVGPLQMQDQPATVAMNRANQHYSTAMNRAEELDGLASRSTPEGAYSAVAGSLKNGSTIYERLRSAVTPEARQKVAATVINDLGAATPGQQNASGDVWSARTFLTNYNKLYRNGGGQALFTRLPGGSTYAKNLADVAKAAEMLGDGAKVWSNPSGTSQALVARGTIGTIGAGAVGGLFYTPLIAPAAVAGGGLILAHQVSQRLLLNPQFVNWLAKAPKVRSPAEMQAYAQRLMVSASMTNNKTYQSDVQAYLDSVGQ